jgi:hypothetical protein
MSPVLATLFCIVAYSAGIFLLIYSTRRILRYTYDDMFFMAIAALEIMGGLLVFAPVGITFALFNASPVIRFVDFILLAFIIGLSARQAWRCFRPWSHPNPLRSASTIRLTGILTGSYFLLLIVAALYALVTTVI